MMSDIKTVGIKELKNNLSAYLREVRVGVRILVSDRNTVIAEICKPLASTEGNRQINPVLEQWFSNGVISLPTRSVHKLPRSPVQARAGTSLKLLEKEREE